MAKGDLVVVPRKTKAAFGIGEIEGPYQYDPKADMPYRHSRAVHWLNVDVPRSVFDQDLLFSLGAIMTICSVRRDRAEERVRAYAQGKKTAFTVSHEDDATVADAVDLERLGRDQIATSIVQKFKGHGLARLVEAVLKAQGYTTFTSPPGPDKGIDILAAPGPLGFGRPRICGSSVRRSDEHYTVRLTNSMTVTLHAKGAHARAIETQGQAAISDFVPDGTESASTHPVSISGARL